MAASLLGGRAGLGLQPADELLDGELLGEGRARVATSRGLGSRGSSAGGSVLDGSGGGGGAGAGGSGSGSRSGAGGGSRAGRSAARARAGARATDGEVNARLVRLVDGAGVPPELEHAVSGLGALASEVRRNGDVEVLLVIADTGGGRRVVVEGDEGRADDGVGGRVDDGHVGSTGVRSSNVVGDGDLLSGRVGLDVAAVLELQTLALPDVAGSLVVVGLVGVLESTLNVAVDVGAPLAEDLVTAGRLQLRTRLTGLRLGEVTVGGNLGGKGNKAESSGVGLHCDWKILLLEELSLVVVESVEA